MTYGIKTVVGITTLKTRSGFFGTVAPLFGGNWAEIKLFRAFTLADLWQYVAGCHLVRVLLPLTFARRSLRRATQRCLTRLTYNATFTGATARHSLLTTQLPHCSTLAPSHR